MYRAFCGGILAVVLWGCGNDTSNPGGNTGNDGGKPNYGEEAFAATIEAKIGWTTGDFTLNGDVVDGCASTSSCVATVEDANLYEVDFEHTHGFVTKLVDVDDETTFNVAWDEYGDWSVKASGVYNNQYGAEVEIRVSEYDFDGDGNDERFIYGDGFACNAIFDEDSFADSCIDLNGNELTFEGWFDGASAGYYFATNAYGTAENFYELIESIEE